MSQGLQLIEPVVVALVDRIENGIAAEVAIANLDITDGYTIEAPAQVLDYIPPLPTILAFPTVGIQHSGGAFEDDNCWSATGVWDAAVVVFVQDADQAGLVRRLRRLTRALARVVLAQRQITGTGVWSVNLVRVDYGPTLGELPPDERVVTTYWSWASLQVQCRQDEA